MDSSLKVLDDLKPMNFGRANHFEERMSHVAGLPEARDRGSLVGDCGDLTLRWSARVSVKVPSPYRSARGAQLNR